MTEEELIKLLEADGFKIADDHISSCKWYAYRRTKIDSVECFCNEKPVQIVVRYFSNTRYGHLSQSIEINVCAQATDKFWYELKSYAIDVNDFVENIDKFEKKLVAAWTAINSVV